MVCLVLIGLPAHVMALDKDQIVQMSEMGLADSAIMGAIDSAGTDLQLDDDDVENLRDQGVSDAVISHLRRRGHVIGDAVADDDDFDDDDDLLGDTFDDADALDALFDDAHSFDLPPIHTGDDWWPTTDPATDPASDPATDLDEDERR